jgi:O-antigen/teichoic acid export membrane protein
VKLLGSAGARQGFWSMADQGAVSLGNFLTSILLARRLAPAEYGIYALLLATVFVLNSVQAAVITYPVSLEGAAESESDLQRRAGGSLVLTMLLAVALTAVLVVATFVLKRPAIWPYAAVALICWQAQETARRALMTHGRHREALWGDVLSYVGQAILVGLLLLWHGITLESAFLVIALTSALAAVLQALQLGLRPRHFREAFHPLRHYWELGRWALLANLARALMTQPLVWFLAIRSTIEVAAFQSLGTVLGLTNPIMFSLSNIVIPAVARRRKLDGNAQAFRAAAAHGLQTGVLILPYFLLLAIFPHASLRIFYGSNSLYAGLGTELRIYVVGYLFVYLAHFLGALFYGLGEGALVFRSQLAGAIAAVLFGLPLAAFGGVRGACAGLALAFAVQTAASLFYLWRRDREEPLATVVAVEFER